MTDREAFEARFPVSSLIAWSDKHSFYMAGDNHAPIWSETATLEARLQNERWQAWQARGAQQEPVGYVREGCLDELSMSGVISTTVRITPRRNRDDDLAIYASPPAQPDAVPRRDPEIEARAKEIYKTWERKDGYVPWVERGNSDKQNEARRIAAQEKV